MSAALPAPPLLFITDRLSTSVDLRDVVRAALAGGCRWIMVREKDLPTDELVALVSEIVALSQPFGASIVVNGDIDAAAGTGVAGVHVQSTKALKQARMRLGSAALIGVSTHSVAEAQAAAAAGADYVTLSPVFPTDSKPGYGPALGLEGLAQARAAVSCPVIALAGITPGNAAACLKASVAGVAVMGGIMRAPDPEAAVRRLIAALGAAPA